MLIMQILEFCFSSFWVWLGMIIMIPVIGIAIAMPIAAIRGESTISVFGDINTCEKPKKKAEPIPNNKN